MKRSFPSCVVVLACALSARPAAAEEQALRPLSTDRPDVTESSHTVDAGHFQAEFDLARYSVEQGERSYAFVGANLKVGLASFWDVQLVLEPLVGVPTADGYDFGPGDTTLRSKFNLFGNDDGALALALMPWFKFSTAGSRGNGAYEGGLILPLGYDLPADLCGGFMLEGDVMGDEVGAGHHYELLVTTTVGHELYGALSFFAEVGGTVSTDAGAGFAAFADGGPVLLVTDMLQLDGGVSVGLTEPADDFGTFLGLSSKL